MKTANLPALALLTCGVALTALPLAQAQIAVKNQGYIPYSDAPIFYRSEDIDDPVTQLQRQLDAGQAKLVYDDGGHGYLKSVLQLLDIPVSSQTLVFSKTSFQYPKISPEHPRALYFNDDVYIGQVHEGKEIEVVSFDQRQGAIFFILHEEKTDQPRFERAELDCTQCHIAAGTRGIPGVLLRSVHPTTTGTLAAGAKTFISDQESPFKERWGGWYVTGKLATLTMANAVTADDASGKTPPLAPLAQSFDAAAYLTRQSDAVALLVLAHQTQMHNLITLTNYRTRIALNDLAVSRNASATGAATTPAAYTPADALPAEVLDKIRKPAEQLLHYLLFANEEPLPDLDAKEVVADSAFAREFPARGPRDSRGRSLRDFDLHTRTFRYPCSYLIYSEDFDALPEPAKGLVYSRLLQVLTGKDQSGDFDALSADERRAVLEILLETKHGLPREWQDYARANHLRVAANS